MTLEPACGANKGALAGKLENDLLMVVRLRHTFVSLKVAIKLHGTPFTLVFLQFRVQSWFVPRSMLFYVSFRSLIVLHAFKMFSLVLNCICSFAFLLILAAVQG